jgi:6-phosphogluconolactonase
MTRTLRRALPAMAAAVMLILGAMTMSPVEAATFVYVGNAESNEIHVLQLDPQSGDLTAVQKAAIPDIVKAGGSTPLAITPDKRLLIAGTRGEPMVAASYRIDPASGKLTHAGSRPLEDSMAYIVTDRTGRYLLSASYPGHKITVNPIDADGTLQPPTQILGTEPNAHAILADPANRYVLVASLGGDIVKQLRFDLSTGLLYPNATSPATSVQPKAGPRHFRFHPNGKLVYLLNELNASVDVFDYDAEKGTLAPKQTVSALPAGFQGKIWAADIHLTPDGKFLYASERGTNTLAAFKVDPSGTLALIGHTPTEQQPRGFAIDPSGRYLLAVGQLSHQMTSYRIDPDNGKLTKLKEYPMGKNPNWVEIIELP